MPLKLAVFLSGTGTTLQNLIDRIADGQLDAEVACVISSREGAYGLERARAAGLPAIAIPQKEHNSPESFSDALWLAADSYEVGLVVLAGFMSLLSVPKRYEGRIVNIHPALIPAFCGTGMYGHHVHEAVLTAGAKVTGATVHFVDGEYDNGPIILQEAIPVLEDDTPDSLAVRVKTLERELYPRAIQLFAENRLHLEGTRVRVLPESAHS